MTRQRAFTLVELLVVIAIITLLVGILTPSLKVVKDLSRVSKCSTSLNAVTRDLTMYVTGNDGLLMPYRPLENPNTHKPMAPAAPWQTTIAYGTEGNPVTNSSTGRLNDPRNLGFGYEREYINDYRVLYCPSQPKEEHTVEYYPVPWGSGPNEVLVGYMYNPNVKMEGSDGVYFFRPEVDTFPVNHPIICDLVWGKDVTSHIVGDEWRWNVSHLNGNVSTIASRTAQDYLLNNPSANQLPDSWSLFNDTVYKWILMQ